MSVRWRSLALSAGLALAAAGCMSAGATQQIAASAVEPPAGALSETEKKRADATVLEAAAAGELRRWNSGRPGYYGLVEPAAAESDANGVCRNFSHTIFIDGLARQESGRACRPRGGVWRVQSDAAG